MTDQVAARPAPHLSIRRARWHESVLGTMWFLPSCAVVAAMVLSRLTVALDRGGDVDPGTSVVLPGDATALAAVASTVASAMLTFVAVVFATTLVAIQLASGQYSPRVVRFFVRSRMTQATLGVFLATFVVALNTLIATREVDEAFVPTTTATLMYALVLGTVVMFIGFAHHMVRLLRVQYLLRLVARESHGPIDLAFPPADAYQQVAAPDVVAAPVLVRPSEPTLRHRGSPRVLQAVDVAGLARAASRCGCWVDVKVAVGEHAGPLTVVAEVHGPDPGVLGSADVRAHLLFGTERTLLQDPGFGLRQLVDTASRALSPAINDPTTAVQALLRVEDLLARVVANPDPSGWYLDDEGTARVRLSEPTFERLSTLGLTEVLHYGAESPQVTRALLAVVDELAAAAPDPARAAHLRAVADLVRATVSERMPAAFQSLASEPDRMGLG